MIGALQRTPALGAALAPPERESRWQAILPKRMRTDRRVEAGVPRDAPLSDEFFRAIYTRAGAGVSETLAVCSAITGEGKSTVALGLAVTIAQDFPELRVLLVETDLQQPVLAADFNVEPTPGLAECLALGESALFAHRPTGLPNLQLMPAGGAATGAARLLRSSRMALMLDSLRGQHDVVILDTPALLVNSDALLLTDLADGVIFVVRAGVTPQHLVQKAVDQVDQEKLRGLVLNAVESHVPRRVRQLIGI